LWAFFGLGGVLDEEDELDDELSAGFTAFTAGLGGLLDELDEELDEELSAFFAAFSRSLGSIPIALNKPSSALLTPASTAF
jgi:hypothetical protein